MYTRKLFARSTFTVASRLLFVLGVGGLALAGAGAGAQINRSRPPSSPPSSGGGGGQAGRGSSSGGPVSHNGGSIGIPSFDRGRTPGISGSGRARTGDSSLDRFRKSQEGAATRSTSGHVHLGPFFPYGYFPGYDPYGYPGYPPYPYPDPYPYPEPYPYPGPRDRTMVAARYDSPYYYCDDMSGGQYVNGSMVVIAKPKHLYAPIPVFRDGDLVAWHGLGADDYFADRNVASTDYRVREQPGADAALDAAVADVRESWAKGDVEPLARHMRKDVQIAVSLQDKYLYSLEPGDFLEVTRAAFGSSGSQSFVADHLHQRTDGVYALTGRHLFSDNKGHERTVYFSYVLTRIQDEYVLTQIASIPDRE
jgi:hypothetical protein